MAEPRRSSNFGRVDALRWWLKLSHAAAPACPGTCFQTQRSKRKQHEVDMADSLEVRARARAAFGRTTGARSPSSSARARWPSRA